jgi:UDP-N-acetylmuramoylalanine--D-glutamate ligase
LKKHPPLDARRVTVMGLGLHGGGLASALFFARRGAAVTVTDLKSEAELRASVEQLAAYPVRRVLGRHDPADFTDADLVIKNPGVGLDSPFLAAARRAGVRIETDVSVFLLLCDNPVLAVTGSKGKSTTASAIHWGLLAASSGARLGGNITVSPLTFLDELEPGAPVVLELSSWQLADLAGCERFKPRVSLITNILPDHLNRYQGMDDYVADKKIIYARQDETDSSIFNLDDPYTEQFRAESRARKLYFSRRPLPAGIEGGWLEGEAARLRLGGRESNALDRPLLLPGEHNRLNLLAAAVALRAWGMGPAAITERLAAFSGLEHRLEFVAEKNGVRYYNDSAATIPHAVREAVRALSGGIVLLTGGADKNIDFAPLADVARTPRAIVLLDGSATKKIAALLDSLGVPYHGPFPALEPAVKAAEAAAAPGDAVLFSPGCASFGLFLNEFDRGRQFKKIVLESAARQCEKPLQKDDF